jgi:hypothetical protein
MGWFFKWLHKSDGSLSSIWLDIWSIWRSNHDGALGGESLIWILKVAVFLSSVLPCVAFVLKGSVEYEGCCRTLRPVDVCVPSRYESPR